MNHLSSRALLAVSLALCPIAAAAAPVIDQDVLYGIPAGHSGLASAFGYNSRISQSFTAGLTGELTGIDVQITSHANDRIYFWIGSGEIDALDYNILGAFSVHSSIFSSEVGSITHVSSSGNDIFLEAGKLYSITLFAETAASGNSFLWLIGSVDSQGVQATNPPYAGGRAVGSFDAGQTWGARGVDRTFRTWVDTNPALPAVPEPASWAMMIFGFGLVGAMARCRTMARHPGHGAA